MSRYGGRAIYVGNLPEGTRSKELEDIFHKFGRIRMVDIKSPPRPPGYAFVEFEDARDAQEAARRRDGYEFGGSRLRVEVAKGGNETQGAPRGAPFRSPRGATGYRLLIKGLPKSASWQDVKDHFRRIVKPLYTEVMRDATGSGVTGIVEFETKDDMRLAIRKLDDTEFKNPFDDRCFIRLEEDNGGRGGGGYDDRGRGGDRDGDRYNDRGGRDDDRNDRGRERERSRSRDAGRRDDDRPTRGRDSRSRSRTASPERKSSRSPDRKSSRSPERKSSRSPDRKSIRSPERKSSRSPNRKSSRSPDRKSIRSPERKSSRSPDRKSSRSPERKSSRSPERKSSRSPERKSSRSPERKSRDNSRDSRDDRKMDDVAAKGEDNDA
ncbi:MAG: hypothetical protein WDW38_010845 [Sanguina aurantia]